MVNDIQKLESAISSLSGIDPNKKAELLGLVASIKSHNGKLARLADSIKTFEGAHPKLIEIIDEISQMLGNIGI